VPLNIEKGSGALEAQKLGPMCVLLRRGYAGRACPNFVPLSPKRSKALSEVTQAAANIKEEILQPILRPQF